jgi:3-dehydroquinate synthase
VTSPAPVRIEIGEAGTRSVALLGTGLIEKAADHLESESGRFFLVFSEGAGPAALQVGAALAGRVAADIAVEDTEGAKSLAGAAMICDAALSAGLRRDDALVAVGGGVVTDMAGFAAAILLRGVAWNAIPTTTAAMADAAIGGKTGVNHPRGKNLIGAFHPPRRILIDPGAARGLSDRDWRAGLVEAFKTVWVTDADASARARVRISGLLERDESALLPLLIDSVAAKAQIVSSDPREGDRRRLLNFGHTLGHAFEAASGPGALRHGEAVAWGIAAALWLSRRRAGLTRDAETQALETLAALGPFPEPVRDANLLRLFLALDKKATAKGNAGVLLESIGRARVEEGIPIVEWLEAATAAAIPGRS